MATVVETGAPETLADVLERIGRVPLHRIAARPAPGTATEADVLAALDAADKRLYELVDGVLVEKDMSEESSLLAGIIVELLWRFVRPRNLGWVYPADGAVRLFPGLVRIPDVCFLRRDRAPGGKRPKTSFVGLVPDLAVEVLSPGNRAGEIKRKLHDYFEAGVRLVWVIDPRKQVCDVYTAPDKRKRHTAEEPFDGGEVLPGFTLTVKQLIDLAE